MKKLNLSLDSIEPLFQKIAALTKIQRILICSAAVVLVLALFIFVFYMPKFDQMERLGRDIQKSEKKLEKSKKNASEYAEFKKKMEEAKARFLEIAQALPNSDEIPSLLTGISRAGKKAGLSFILFEPQKEQKKDFYAEIPVKMELRGSYHDLGMFFDHLARLSRIVNVTRFSIKASKTPGKSLNIACTAVTYKFIPNAGGKKKKRRKKR